MTDHKHEALMWTDDSPINPLSTEDPGIVNARKIELAQAQVHATLYLAEQQRIANLIAWHGFVDLQGDLPDHASELARQIHEALGVS